MRQFALYNLLMLFAACMAISCANDMPENTLTPIGSLCSIEVDSCAPGLCLILLNGGYCTERCDLSADRCPQGSACSTLEGGSYCLKRCTNDTDCRTAQGYRCLDELCQPGCEEDSCEQGQTCIDGRCEELDPLELGEACERSAQCESDTCLLPGAGGACTEPCTAQGCRVEGWVCRGLIPQGADTAYNVCAPPSQPVLELSLDGEGRYAFDVGTDVRSFQVIAEGPANGRTMQIFNIRQPNGEQIAGLPNARDATEPFRTSANSGYASMGVPQSLRFGPTPGRWSFQLIHSGVNSVRVYFERGLEEPETLRFDLDIFLSPGLPLLDAASAPTDARLQDALVHMQDQYASSHGFQIGDVQYYDLPGEHAYVADQEELKRMFVEQSVQGRPEALNIFIVQDLLSNGSGTSGVSGGLPGPAGLDGLTASGVAVQFTEVSPALGDVIAHELGHFWGLFHVSESDGNLHDVIADTPNCEEPPDIATEHEPCLDNLMYPILLYELGLQQRFSETQAHIIRRSRSGVEEK